WSTQTDATHLKFFNHPLNNRGPNFRTPHTMTFTVDGRRIMSEADSLAATPGLLPLTTPDLAAGTTGEMLDNMLEPDLGSDAPAALSPANGVCPEPLEVSSGGENYEIVFECN
ncbi:MAG: hypothetical protein COS89_04400, partial [Deltaproteobacteria bacterium CG07_land_8_20_14_0_80_38_7]